MKQFPLPCAGTLPPVQKAVFSLLPTLAPAELPQLWPDLLQLLLNLLRPHQLLAQASSVPAQEPAAAVQQSPGAKSSNVNRHALSALSMETAVDILAQLYRCARRLLLLGSLPVFQSSTFSLVGSMLRADPAAQCASSCGSKNGAAVYAWAEALHGGIIKIVGGTAAWDDHLLVAAATGIRRHGRRARRPFRRWSARWGSAWPCATAAPARASGARPPQPSTRCDAHPMGDF